MCGLFGWISTRGVPMASLDRMATAAVHRGPDGQGFWFRKAGMRGGCFKTSVADVSAEATVALGHRRLAILDLSDAGAQPMGSPDGQRWIVFNGEIFNYLELKKELE